MNFITVSGWKYETTKVLYSVESQNNYSSLKSEIHTYNLQSTKFVALFNYVPPTPRRIHLTFCPLSLFFHADNNVPRPVYKSLSNASKRTVSALYSLRKNRIVHSLLPKQNSFSPSVLSFFKNLFIHIYSRFYHNAIHDVN